MSTFNIPDISNNPQSVTVNPNGRADAVNSKPIALANEDKTVLDAVNTNTAATTTALTDVTDTDGSLQVAFYYNGVKVDPTAAGAIIGATLAGSPLAFAPVTEGGLAKTGNPAIGVENESVTVTSGAITRAVPATASWLFPAVVAIW